MKASLKSFIPLLVIFTEGFVLGKLCQARKDLKCGADSVLLFGNPKTWNTQLVSEPKDKKP